MELKTLYKLDVRGGLRQWTIRVEGNSYWSEQGTYGGKIVSYTPTVVSGKNQGRSNATTAQEQAFLEARAKWVKQTERGYVENIDDVEKPAPLYKAMLAQKFEDRVDDLTFPVYTQPKLDGIRCIVRKENGVIVAKSRAGKAFDTIPHIVERLEQFFEKNPNAILDGELYNHDLKDNFNKIISLVRKKKPVRSANDTDKSFNKKLTTFKVSLAESKEMIQYWVYDAPKVGDLDESDSFISRFHPLMHQMRITGISRPKMLPGPLGPWEEKFPPIVIVQTNSCEDLDTVDLRYREYTADGYEGQMVRVDGPYENKRSKGLLKRKEFMDSEYLVIDIHEGLGNRTGTAKNLICKDEKSGKTFHSNIKGTFEYLTEILENKDNYIGKYATIKYFELTPDGIPRFPHAIAFRDYE